MSFGIFEAAVSSEVEAGINRQASVDALAAATYDVREKLGPFLFQASTIEEFRDRVALVKNDKSLFNIIEAHLPPVTGTVRRIAGKNGQLEKEFKAILMAGLNRTSSDDDCDDDDDDSDDKPFKKKDSNPFGSKGKFQKKDSNPFDKKKSKDDDDSDDDGDDDAPPWAKSSRLHQAEVWGATDEETGNEPGSWLQKPKKRTEPVLSNRRRAELEGEVKTKSTFKPSDDVLEPEGNWDAYLNKVDQHSDKVKKLFASSMPLTIYADWCEANNAHPLRLASLDAYSANLDDLTYMRIAKVISSTEHHWGPFHTRSGDDVEPIAPLTPSDEYKHHHKLGPFQVDWSAGKDAKPERTAAGVGELWSKWQQNHTGLGGDYDYEQFANDTGVGQQALNKLKQQHQNGGITGGRQAAHPENGAGPGDYPGNGPASAWNDDPGHEYKTQDEIDAQPRPSKRDPAGHSGLPQLPEERYRSSGKDPLHSYVAWCKKNGYERISARNVAIYTRGNPQLAIHIGIRMRNAVRVAKMRNGQGYRTAAPDYLQKADDALTQLLNQKAEEFQETIAPLQQALVTVQQATQLQQQQSPLNVQPPAGTVNVMPGGPPPPGTAQQVGMPDPNAPDTSALVQALAGGGGAPGGGMPDAQNGPPPAAPPPPDPTQQIAAGRGGSGKGRGASSPRYADALGKYLVWCNQHNLRAANKRVADWYVGQIGPDEGFQLVADASGLATGDPSTSPYEQGGAERSHLNDGPQPVQLQALPGMNPVGRSRGGPSDGNINSTGESLDGAFDGIGSAIGAPHHSAKEPADIAAEASKQSWRQMNSSMTAYGYKWDEGANAWTKPNHKPIRNHWQHTGGLHDYDPHNDDQIFAPARGHGWEHSSGPSGVPYVRPQPNEDYEGHPTPHHHEASHKQAWSGWGPAQFPRTRQVGGWDWDQHLNGYVSHAPRQFECACGEPFPAPTGFHRCACGKQWNSYVIGSGGSNREASTEKFLVREIPTRENVIVANRQLEAGQHSMDERPDGEPVNPYLGRPDGTWSDGASEGHWDKPRYHPDSEEADAQWWNNEAGRHRQLEATPIPPNMKDTWQNYPPPPGYEENEAHQQVHPHQYDAVGHDPLPRRSFVELVDPRTGNLHNLVDPGQLDEGEEDGLPKPKKMTKDWHHRDKNQRWTAMRKGAPFAGYEDFDDCTSENSDKDRPDAYCGEIKHRTEDKG